MNEFVETCLLPTLSKPRGDTNKLVEVVQSGVMVRKSAIFMVVLIG
jgi:hypothetical protein